MAASAAAKKKPVQFTIDLSDGQTTHSEPTKFDNLCDSVTSCYISHGNCLTELYKLKDELLKHSLPPCLLLQLTLASSRIYRSYSDLSVPMREMTRLVKQYSMPWEEKGTVLKKLKADYESKRQQLSIAVKHLEMVASEEERMHHERRLNNWMRLYSRVMATKSHGRRWKFRIEPFKKKLAHGYNPYGSDSDSDDDTEEEESSVVSGSRDEHDEFMGKTAGLPTDLSQALASRLSGDLTKRVHFSARDLSARPPGSPMLDTPPSASPTVETAEAACWTGEPDYTDYLLVLLYRPKGLLYDRNICCTLSLEGQFFKSQVFEADDEETNGLPFHFLLSEKAVKQLAGSCHQPTDEEDDEELIALLSAVKLTVAVFPRTVAEPMAAHCSIPLSDLQLTKEDTVLVPPDTREVDSSEEEESDGFQVDWDQLSAARLDLVQYPQSIVEYPLKYAAMEEDREDEEELATLPLVCHRVRVQWHKLFHTATSTGPWSLILEEEGYRKMRETVSAATSAIALPDKPQTPPPPPSPQPQEEEEKEDRMTAEQVAALSLSHVEEMKQLQEQYEKKLGMLSRTLARVKKDKEEQIQSLEQALSESEASKGRKQRSSLDLQAWLERRRRLKNVDRGLPVWGKDLPENFFERLELFAVESQQKHQELTGRIRREVQEACEKQLALQHRLAPPTTDANSAMEDVCLPALFLPTNPVSSRAVVFNPRAHSYFHPPGSSDARVSQPPSIFKLPPVQANQLATLNLYDLTHSNTAQTGPTWLKSSDQYSQQPAPAPPPSACDFYNHREHSGGSRQPRFSPQPISGRNSRLDTA